jgi:hypothetical protein
LNNGVVEAFGPRAEVLARFARPSVVKPMTPPPSPTGAVASSGIKAMASPPAGNVASS